MSEDVNPSQKGPRAGFSIRHSHNFVGGLTIALLALVLLLWTFYISSPAIPRLLAIVIGLTAAAAAAGILPVRSPQDFYGGLVLMLLGDLALVASAELPGQRGFAFGPGTAPRLFSGMLAVCGAAIAAMGIFVDGPKISPYKIRGPALVIGAILLFAAMIRPFGLVVATYLAFLISISGSSEMRWLESFIAAAVMTAFCVFLFVYLLNLPFQLWPNENSLPLLMREIDDLLKPLLAVFRR